MSRFDQLFTVLHYIWIMPIQGAVITFLIWRNVGIASLAGIFLITIQTIPLQGNAVKLLKITHVPNAQLSLCTLQDI